MVLTPWVLWLTANTPAQIVHYHPTSPYDVSGGAVLSLMLMNRLSSPITAMGISRETQRYV